MNTMITGLSAAEAEFVEWLNEHLRVPVATRTQLNAWLDCLDENGHVEIRARESVEGYPRTGVFPALAE